MLDESMMSAENFNSAMSNQAQVPVQQTQQPNQSEIKIQQFTMAIQPLMEFVNANPIQTGEDKELQMAIEKYLKALNDSQSVPPANPNVAQY